MIAIHHENYNFSERWIRFSEENGIKYKIVDCYANDILEQLKDCQGLMWHWNHRNPASFIIARQLIISAELKGLKVFPSFNTCWHYDDKVGQKYLLESIQAPLVKSYVFYRLKDAEDWINKTTFPKVFKLRGGYGSNNVRLIKSPSHAKRLARQAFKNGFSQRDRLADFQNRRWKFSQTRTMKSALNVAKGFFKLFLPSELDKLHGREKGYLYFQEFIPNNLFDIRIIVIGNRAVGIKRYNRKNDFRASGSGLIDYNYESIDVRCVKTSFNIARKLDTQSLAFDFVFDSNGKPLIIEISYCYSLTAYDKCPGYWDSNLDWHQADVCLQNYMIEDLIKSLES